ncbi:ATP-dependent DNA helicase RecG [Amphibiibacter pelophylacis]|uniref:ATP-dependent DNA helicase RecG n=1 Tax=Amphibiibacter pelophylacis TaxID=1799477 RepID=A0ACC6P4E5_9BURK
MSAAAKASPAARALIKLGLVDALSRALHLPLRYEDETRLTPPLDSRPGESVLVELEMVQVPAQPPRPGQPWTALGRCVISGQRVQLRFVHAHAGLRKLLEPGQRVRAFGEVRHSFSGCDMVHPQVRAVQPGEPLPATLTPVYPTSASLPQNYLRKSIAAALPRAPLHECFASADQALPRGLLPLRQAVLTLHHPAPTESLDALLDRTHPAWQRIKYDELLAQQLSQKRAQQLRRQSAAPRLAPHPNPLAQALLQHLPFALTPAQERVLAEIQADLSPPARHAVTPMHRLLQGDVGSGKTVVAALAACMALAAGWQCALMAPTEILAEQLFGKLVEWLEPLGVQVAWLSGSVKGRRRAAMLEAAASGQAGLVVGTHAVIEQQVRFARLGLVIIDEQHRFGVQQRLTLKDKASEGDGAGADPRSAPLEAHLLMMSATPIPRTLAMSYFADLDLSVLDGLPPGRSPIVTRVLGAQRRDEVIARMSGALEQGRQIYWVCPLVEESEKLDLENATATHALLSERLAPWPVALLHGRMKAPEKAAVMAAFKAGEARVLVATTVIEVGVDVPNASLMIVEHAERFGLSQLHQLRGRVGRGSAASACVLLHGGPLSQAGRARLQAMAQTQDGFEIARRDLEIRGPGEFLGARQSGAQLLRFADVQHDGDLLDAARERADRLLAQAPEACDAHIARWLGHRTEFIKA